MGEETEEVITPNWWEGKVWRTLVALAVAISTIGGAVLAADDYVAKQADVTAQFDAISQTIAATAAVQNAAVVEVKADLAIKTKGDERASAQSRVYELDDRLLTARSFQQQQDFKRLKREQEERLRVLDLELERLANMKAQAAIIREGGTIPSPLPVAAPFQ